MIRRRSLSLIVAMVAVCLPALKAAQRPSLSEQIQQVLSRPIFRHANFGIEFYSLDKNQPVYELNPQKLFTPASTTKLVTEGAALALLGPDYRFHTRVYRTGQIDSDGELHGNLVLVASGDPNLSQRIQPGGTLAFENDDHCYGGPPVPGDPLAVLRQLAEQVVQHGIKAIDGSVLVDASLFPEGEREQGTETVISPVVVNDNIIDVAVTPGAVTGAPVSLRVSPVTPYLRITDLATTGPAASEPNLQYANDQAGPDGSHTVTLTGSVPAGKPPVYVPYAVPVPSRFAEMAFAEALHDLGITAVSAAGAKPDFSEFAAFYTLQNLVAEHVSPPLAQDVRITLKVSQNLHASLMPYILGAVLGHASQKSDQAGFKLERGLLMKAGLDLSGASQSDGAGGSRAAFFTPDFMVHYLAYIYHSPLCSQILAGLPVLGRDGTLADIQTDSPAAGHIFAKTGTYFAYDELNQDEMVTGKGLAGYVTTRNGQHLAFAVYANHVAVPDTDNSISQLVGQALGEIAAAAY